MRSITKLCFFVCVVAALGCGGLRSPVPLADACSHVVLEPSPIWTASAAWSSAGDRLVLVDPQHRGLLVYDAAGRFLRRVGSEALAAIEYATPVRLFATEEGYLLGDKHRLLWLDHELRPIREVEPFRLLANRGVRSGRLNDFVALGDQLYAYADFEIAGEDGQTDSETGDDQTTWHRGFVRLDLERGELTTLYEVPLEQSGEMAGYYDYHVRPYLARLDDRPYVLRFTTPPAIHRAKRRRLAPVYVEREEQLRPIALHAWEGGLYLLLAPRPRIEWRGDAPLPPNLRHQGAGAELVAARPADAEPDEPRWFLVEIDPKSGEPVARYRLPSTAPRLAVIPGRPYWTLLEESRSPNMSDGETRTRLLRLPAQWLTSSRSVGSDPGEPATLRCDAPSPSG